MSDYDYLRLDHCTISGFKPSAAKGMQIARAAFDKESGWLGLTSQGVVQFHTNLPLQGQRVTIAVPVAHVELLGTGSPVPLSTGKSLQADFGGHKFIVVFSGLKKGITKADGWIGRVPHVGHLTEAGLFMAREFPGSGDRARDAMQTWTEILRGELAAADLPVIGTWPGHDRDVAPIVRTAVPDGAVVVLADWKVELTTRKRRNWFELTVSNEGHEWLVRWENSPERLTCSATGDPAGAVPLTWCKTGEKGPGKLLSRTWWVVDIGHAGLRAELVAAMTVEFGAEPSDVSLRINGQEVFRHGTQPPAVLAAGAL